MKKKTLFFLFLLMMIALVIGYGKVVLLPRYNLRVQQKIQEAFLLTTPTPAPKTDKDPFENINDIFMHLSPAEKVGQVMAFPIIVKDGLSTVASKSSVVKTDLPNFIPGFVTLFGESISSQSAKTAVVQLNSQLTQRSSKGILPAIAVDHEGGTVQRLSGKGFTRVRNWEKMCEEDNVLFASTATTSARELQAVGVDIIFGPVVDVGVNKTLGNRICSSSTTQVLEASRTWSKIFLENGITPVLKHYPGIGNGEKDLHQEFESVATDTKQKQVFDQLLINPLISVMTSHQGIATPCSLDANCIKQLNLNTSQLVFTDALEMKAVTLTDKEEVQALELVSMEAIKAGNSVLVFGKSAEGQKIEKVFTSLQSRYEQDEEFRKMIDIAVKKILLYKYEKRLIIQ